MSITFIKKIKKNNLFFHGTKLVFPVKGNDFDFIFFNLLSVFFFVYILIGEF